jgi:hypothetical protein
MDESRIADFTASYMAMHEEDLARLSGRRSTLVEEAQAALDTVLVNRSIDVAGLREEERQETLKLANREQEARIREERRHASHIKIFFWICVPITLLGILFNPERSYFTFISTLTQGVVLGLIGLLIVVIRRAITRRRKQ